MIRYYYWITPLFILLDIAGGWNLRIAALADPAHRTAYYLFLLACAGAMWKLPRFTPFIAVVESGVNFFLLIGSVMLPILGYGHLLKNPVIGFAGWTHLANFFITGLILSTVIRRNSSLLPDANVNR
ncbi:MAG: hypothetical protein AB8B96_03735 [Lysobacterales bacterium]